MKINENQSKGQILKQLFLSTLMLSGFTFGGGYVIITLMKKTFVDDYGWIDEDEMLDLVAIAQSAPGAIAVNGAIVVGYKLAGMLGVLTAVIATIIPPFAIISLIALFYDAFRENTFIALMLEGMQAGVGAVITAVVIGMGQQVTNTKSPLFIATMFIAFIANYIFNVNVMLIILVAASIGLIQFFFNRNKGGMTQ
ncbi:MAG: chromate transporter [Ruoffia tabacinasalis]|uniref:chromate transporter n=1 Tax=Ruoffia sp. FAM 26255 TaxID=3259519 RepID=UPI0038841719